MSDLEPRLRTSSENEESPPLGRGWGLLYAIVAGWLLLLIVLFHVFTRAFA